MFSHKHILIIWQLCCVLCPCSHCLASSNSNHWYSQYVNILIIFFKNYIKGAWFVFDIFHFQWYQPVARQFNSTRRLFLLLEPGIKKHAFALLVIFRVKWWTVYFQTSYGMFCSCFVHPWLEIDWFEIIFGSDIFYYLRHQRLSEHLFWSGKLPATPNQRLQIPGMEPQ